MMCVVVGRTSSLFSQRLSSRPSGPSMPMRRRADKRAATALLVSPWMSIATSNRRERSSLRKASTVRGDLSHLRGTRITSSIAL